MSGVVNSISSLFGLKQPDIKLESTTDKEVQPNDEAALRNAQDKARRRRGVAANIMSDPNTTTAGAVASKTLTGQ